ncbi:MAG: caspase family protein [Spirochaetota bacterium]|nr:caspase family protein [Spirochaetota bacterium]
MNRVWKNILVVLMVLSMTAGLSAAERFALVIGNSNYTEITPLRNPANDAADVANTLTSIGFEVDVLLDADLRSMRDAVRSLGDRLTVNKDSVGLFFYAGHGVQSGGENYLIPVMADIRTDKDLPYEALNANYILDYLNEAGSSFNMIILDACRDNPFSTFRSAGRGLAVVEAPRGSIVMYSTGAGQVAADGTGRNSTFTAALLDHMTEDGIEVNEMVRRVMRDVANNTDGIQVPAFYSNYFGTFRFVGSGSPASLTPAVTPAATTAQVLQPAATVLSPLLIEGIWKGRRQTGWSFDNTEYRISPWWGDSEVLSAAADVSSMPEDLAAAFREYEIRHPKLKRNSMLGFVIGMGGDAGAVKRRLAAPGSRSSSPVPVPQLIEG